MKILNKEIEFSFEDAENMDKVQSLELKYQEKLQQAKATVEQCQIYKEFFDKLIGEGTSKEIFGDKNNILQIIDAYQDVVNEAERVATKINEKSAKMKKKYERYK